jgi:hypothetical protein
MTFVVDGTNGLTFNDATTQSSTATNASNISSGTLGKARLPTGSVLQVVQGSFGGTSSTTSTSMVSTSLNASITPSSSSSKVLVLVAGSAANNGLNQNAILSIFRSTTNLASASFTYHANPVSGLNNWQSVNMQYLDSPATTSSTTYTVYLMSSNASATAYLGTGANTNIITVMEIAA